MIILGTTNLNKLKEYSKIIPDFELTIMDNMDIIEDGTSFLENATIKANAVFNKYHKCVLCDDSGLEILSLKGFPGIYSSRFENNRGYEVACKDILDRLKDFDDRRARYVCAVVTIDEFGNKYSAIGYLNGTIGYEYKGNGGFGYDPIFIPDGYDKTFGELGSDIKNSISHRKQAIERLLSKVPLKYIRRYKKHD